MRGDVTFTSEGACDASGPLMPPDAAAALVSWLEGEGASFTLDADNFFHLNMNPMAGMDHEQAATISKVVFSLRDEIRTILVARRTVH